MLRVATFNVENLDEKADEKNPLIEVRAPILRVTLNRLNADILCLQEVHGQDRRDHAERKLAALDYLLKGTRYESYHRVSTLTSDNEPYEKRNLVIISSFPIKSFGQYKNRYIDNFQYRKVTALSKNKNPEDLSWERPILHVQVDVPKLGNLHLINLHLKSRQPSDISGQKDRYMWNSPAGWAEGYFVSSMKRIGQALETRMLLDKIFNEEPLANVIVCGGFNAEPGEVPIEVICGRVENTHNLKLRSHVLVPCSGRIPESLRFSHLHHGNGHLLDHMLISQSLLANFRYAGIYNENLHDESLPFTFETKYPESDHAAFVGEFSHFS